MLDLILAHPVKMGGDGQGTNLRSSFSRLAIPRASSGAMKFVNSKAKSHCHSRPSQPSPPMSASVRAPTRGLRHRGETGGVLARLQEAQAAALAKKAHVVCPYSYAIRRNVKVTTKSSIPLLHKALFWRPYSGSRDIKRVTLPCRPWSMSTHPPTPPTAAYPPSMGFAAS